MKVVLGLTGIALSFVLLALVYGSTFADLYRPEETLAVAGGKVLRDAFFMRRGHQVYADYDVKKRWGSHPLYKVTAEREEVGVLELHVDADGDRLYYDVRTATGLVGKVGWLERLELPHIDIASRLTTGIADAPGKLWAALLGLAASVEPEYRHTRVYALIGVLTPGSWRFVMVVALGILALAGTALGVARRLPKPRMARKSMMRGLMLGAIAGFFSYWSLQDAAVFLAGAGPGLIWPSGSGLTIWVIWLTGALAVATVPLLVLQDRFNARQLAGVALTVAVSLLAGFLVAHGLLATLAWTLGQAVSLASKAFRSLLPLLILFAITYAFFFGTSTGSSGPIFSGMRKGRSDVDEQNELRRREQAAAARRAENEANREAEAAKQRAYAAKEWERWK